jgi:hypothetical protein
VVARENPRERILTLRKAGATGLEPATPGLGNR